MRKGSRFGETNNTLMGSLVGFIQNQTYDRLPEELLKMATIHLYDTISVTLAGWHDQPVEILKKEYCSSDTDFIQLLQHTKVEKNSIEAAALIYGTASHSLDYDDAGVGVVMHPSAPVVSAILPLSVQQPSIGKDVITAFVIGTEMIMRIGQLLHPHHYKLGWHSTSTIGVIGATAACAYLLQLNSEQCKNALAMACSMSSGLQKNFGSMTKPLHVGLAASNAIRIAKLAKQNFTGNERVFETKGFLDAFTGGDHFDRIQANIPNISFGDPFYYVEKGVSLKKFPCCFGNHRFIQATLNILKKHSLSLDEIEEIILEAQQRSYQPLVHDRPTDGLQGKFSPEYTVLATVADGAIRLNSFTDEMVQREKIQKLIPKVKRVEIKEEKDNHLLPVKITVKKDNGDILQESIQYPPGSKESPLSLDEMMDKWSDCIRHYFKQKEISEQIYRGTKKLFAHCGQVDQSQDVSQWLLDFQYYMNEMKEDGEAYHR